MNLNSDSLIKKLICFLLSALVILACACGKKTVNKLSSVSSITDHIYQNAVFPEMTEVDADTLEEIFGVNIARLKEWNVKVSSDKLLADETGVFELSDDGYAEELVRMLEARIAGAARAAENYSPDQYSILTKAEVCVVGRFVYYIVNAGSQKLSAELKNSIGE